MTATPTDTPGRTARCGTMAEVAAYLGRPVNTMRDWRLRGIGPRSYRQAGQVRYDWSDVDAWLDSEKSASA
jgi:hypothetical protein